MLTSVRPRPFAMTARRILFLNAIGVIGGQEMVLLDIVRGLEPGRYAGVVASLAPGELTETLRAEGRPAYVLPPHRLRQPVRLGRTLRALASVLERERVELVHCNGDSLLFYGALAALPRRLPCVWHVHEPVVRHGSAYERFFYQTQRLMRPAFTIANTETVRESYVASYPRLGPSSAINPSVDVESLGRGADAERGRRRFGLPVGVPLLLVIGRLQRSKGQREAVEALAATSGLEPAPHLVLCGGPPFGIDDDFPAALEALVRSRGLTERVHLVGMVSEAEKRDLLAACTALVHPAAREAFGIVVIEGMAAGRPVIVTDAAGPKSIVEGTGAGEVVPRGDVPALARAIARVLADPERARRMGELGRARAAERYDTRAMVRSVERVYDSVLGQ